LERHLRCPAEVGQGGRRERCEEGGERRGVRRKSVRRGRKRRAEGGGGGKEVKREQEVTIVFNSEPLEASAPSWFVFGNS
jgi:hypothetical protein